MSAGEIPPAPPATAVYPETTKYFTLQNIAHVQTWAYFKVKSNSYIDICLKSVPGPQTINAGMLNGREKSCFFLLGKIWEKTFLFENSHLRCIGCTAH